MSRKVVVTGLGAITPIGSNAKTTWQAALLGTSGAATLQHGWVEEHELPVTFAAEVKNSPAEKLSKIEMKRLDPCSQFAVLAAREAWEDANISDFSKQRLGVCFATGIGGVWTLINAWDTLKQRGARRVLPLTVPMLMPNAAAAAVSLDLGAQAGAHTPVSACASGSEAIAQAVDLIKLGKADIVVAGGTEAAIHPLPIAAFSAMQALSKRNTSASTASRPYDVSRDGFVMGEGAGAIVLESEEHALGRGAKVYAELAGAALTSDSYHITAPDPEGVHASRAIELALVEAGLDLSDIVHINAHATSTPVGDIAEYKALKNVFGNLLDGIAISATKSQTGHLLGASGAVEAIFTIQAVASRFAPLSINLFAQDPQIPLDIVTAERKLKTGDIAALSNSFGFGGHNAVLVIKSV